MGLVTDEKITPLIKSDGKVDYSGEIENKKSEITRLQEEVIKKVKVTLISLLVLLTN